jgi:hypothetical protein
MGFNYLQTDDRDDYFAQFNKKPKRKPESFTLINQNNEVVLSEVDMHKVRTYAKKTYLPFGKSAKHIWRKLLEDRGYKVVNNYADAVS